MVALCNRETIYLWYVIGTLQMMITSGKLDM